MKINQFLSFALLFVVMLFVCGCDRSEPMLLFNNQPITQRTVNAPVTVFYIGDTVHYVLLNPEGFKSPYLRVQVVKKETKTQNWGFKIYTTRDVKVDDTKNFYIDSLQLHKTGSYMMSIFYLDDLQRPITRATFVVK